MPTITGSAGDDVLNEVMGDGVTSIDGGGGVNTLNANWSAAIDGVTFNEAGLASGTLQHGAPGDTLTFDNIQSLHLTTGSGDDVFGLNRIDANSSIDGGGGVNTINLDISGGSHSTFAQFWGSSNNIQDQSNGAQLNLSNIRNFNFLGGTGQDQIGLYDPTPIIHYDGGGGTNYVLFFFYFSTSNLSFSLDASPGATSTVFGQGDTATNVQSVGFYGGSGNDNLAGAGGQDFLSGGLGINRLDGRGGSDWVQYEFALAGVTVSLADTGPQNTVGAGIDTLVSIENIFGSNYDDTLTGDSGDNSFFGRIGNDTIDGGAGYDTARFSADLASYSVVTDSLGVTTVRDLRPPSTGNFDGTDTLTNIEVLGFTDGVIVLSPPPAPTSLSGGPGDDTLVEVLGDGITSVDGMGGFNTLSADWSAANDAVTLTQTGPNSGALQHADTSQSLSFSDIQRLSLKTGSGDDTFNINDINQVGQLDGGAGSNTLNVDLSKSSSAIQAGALRLLVGIADQSTGTLAIFENIGTINYIGSSGPDSFVTTSSARLVHADGGGGMNFFEGHFLLSTADLTFVLDTAPGAISTVQGQGDTVTNFQVVDLFGGTGNDHFVGGNGDDFLGGGYGTNVLDGGGGRDYMTYYSANAGVTVSLAITGPQDTIGAGVDTLISIENLYGSGFDDTLTGDAGDNVFFGISGNDTIDGGAGDDTAKFSGNLAEYVVSTNGSGVTTVRDLLSPDDPNATRGADGTDTLTNVEHLQFADQTISAPKPTAGNDLTGDGSAEILWRNANNGDVYLWTSSGNTVAAPGIDLGLVGSNWHVDRVADFDGDGKADILWRNAGNGDSYLWTSSGNAVAAPGVDLGIVELQWQVQAAADFNGDGKADILWRNLGNGDAYLFTSSANAIAAPGQDLGVVGLQWHVQAAADFDGDGKADILWRNYGNGDVYLWTSSGNTLAAPGQDLGIVELQWQVQAVADFNGDGKADILWRNMGNGDVYLFTSSANGVAAPGMDLGIVELQWQVQQADDFNCDGRADILWRNGGNGDAYLWTSSANAIAAPGVDLGIVATNWQIIAPTIL